MKRPAKHWLKKNGGGLKRRQTRCPYIHYGGDCYSEGLCPEDASPYCHISKKLKETK